jgi:hypothetical protein
MGNHPFFVVKDARFRRYIKSVNSAAKIPNRTTLRNLLAKEYQLAIPQVRKILQSALGIIHFTFDGWTSRQNNSFLDITGHFIDKNWEHCTVFLGLSPFLNRHIGDAIAEEIAAILRFFGVKNR